MHPIQKQPQRYIPFISHPSQDFGEDAIQSQDSAVFLQFANGLDSHITARDADRNFVIDQESGEIVMEERKYKGFFLKMESDAELDKACMGLRVPYVDIAHAGGIVRHWAIEAPSLFLMAKGLPSGTASNGDLGSVYVWRDDGAKSGGLLNIQCVLKCLLPHYTKPVILTVRRHQARFCLDALRKQYAVLAYAKQLAEQAGRTIRLPLWAYSIRLQASRTPVLVGKAPNQSKVWPIIVGVPDDLPHEYLAKNEVPSEFVEHFRSLTEQSVAWAQERSIALLTQDSGISDDPSVAF